MNRWLQCCQLVSNACVIWHNSTGSHSWVSKSMFSARKKKCRSESCFARSIGKQVLKYGQITRVAIHFTCVTIIHWKEKFKKLLSKYKLFESLSETEHFPKPKHKDVDIQRYNNVSTPRLNERSQSILAFSLPGHKDSTQILSEQILFPLISQEFCYQFQKHRNGS